MTEVTNDTVKLDPIKYAWVINVVPIPEPPSIPVGSSYVDSVALSRADAIKRQDELIEKGEKLRIHEIRVQEVRLV